MIDQITPLVITYNEGANIARTLEKLRWAKQIVLVDSGSTDETLQIASRYPQVIVLYREFDNFASQCNFGISQIFTEWALSLDADYLLSDQLVHELKELRPDPQCRGYRARFVYCIYGRPLRSSLYPPRVVLYRAKAAQYHMEGHGHRVEVSGEIKCLKSEIYHDDRKPLSRWLKAQQNYAKHEVDNLLVSSSDQLSKVDKIRRLGWPAPILVALYLLFWKGCLFDGWAGWFYVLQRLLAEVMVALELTDRRLQPPNR